MLPYGCFRVKISVNGVSQQSEILRVAGVPQPKHSSCVNAPTEQVLDFSNVMDAHHPINVTLSDAYNDNCLKGSNDANLYGCQLGTDFNNLMIAAVASQTDGTVLPPLPTPAPIVTTPTPVVCNGNCHNLPPALEQKITLTGSNGTNPEFIMTNNGGLPPSPLVTAHTLRIKILPLPAPNLPAPWSNWNIAYGCLQITVKANGVVRTTQALSVAGAKQPAKSVCATSPSSEVLDYSDTLSGSSPVSITFQNPLYDNCRLANTSIFGCQMLALFQTHLAAFLATIQVDSTYMP